MKQGLLFGNRQTKGAHPFQTGKNKSMAPFCLVMALTHACFEITEKALH